MSMETAARSTPMSASLGSRITPGRLIAFAVLSLGAALPLLIKDAPFLLVLASHAAIAGIVALTRADLARGDRDAAARRMHTLRSNAGFICALEIMDAARVLETAIERVEGDEGDEGDDAQISAELDALEARIVAIVDAARTLA